MHTTLFISHQLIHCESSSGEPNHTRLNVGEKVTKKKRSLSVDRSYTGGLVLCMRLSQAQDDHIRQTSIEPVCSYHIGAPEHSDDT